VALPLFLTKLLVRLGVARWLPGVRRRLDGGGDFLRYYSDCLLAAPFAELERAAGILERHGADVIDLAQGTPAIDPVPSGSTKLSADRRGWPPVGGLPDLRAAVAEKLLADNGLAVNPAEEVLITPGALGAVQVVLDTFVNRGERVVLFDPTSPLYPLAVRTRGARIRWLGSWLEDGRTRFRLEHLARSLRRARLLVLTVPANPTGGILAAEDLEQIAWWADRLDVLILCDEVFGHYQYDAEPVRIGTLPRARRRTLTVGSVSKSHGLASARVGWLAGHRHLVRPCLATLALRTPFVPTLSQQVALAALRSDPAVLDVMRDEFAGRRRYAFERLRTMGLNPGWPAGAFFFWVPVWEMGLSGRTFAEGLLREKKVLVTPGDLFGPSGPGYVRLSYAAADGRLREGLNRLDDFLHETRSRQVKEDRRAAA
jgi:aspartate/methionine/tyrosine aminotransferase